MKPLTRSEWDRLEPELRQRLGGGTWGRLLTTIEAGGFAPEPVSVEDLLIWLHGQDGRDRRAFDTRDLGAAMERAEGCGFEPTVSYLAGDIYGWSLTFADDEDERRRTTGLSSLGAAARILTALAYQRHSGTDGGDVSHLTAKTWEGQP